MQDKNEEALSVIKEVIRIKPNSKIAYLLLASILGSQNKLDDAISAGRTSIELDDNGYEVVDSMAHSLLGKIFYKQGKVDAAIAENKEAIRIFPLDAFSHDDLGRLLILQGVDKKEVNKINEGIS